MGEIVGGIVQSVEPDYLIIRVPYSNMERFVHRQYEECRVELVDGRSRTPKQMGKAWAIMADIAEWAGYRRNETYDEVYRPFAEDFSLKVATTLEEKFHFHLSRADETTAREFISFLVDFVLENNVPCSAPLYENADDIQRYVYSCVIYRKCAVCGADRPDLHHAVYRVGMGRNREKINHIGMPCLPLCRKHHMLAHNEGDKSILQEHHLVTVPIDEKIATMYKLGSGNEYDEQEEAVNE